MILKIYAYICPFVWVVADIFKFDCIIGYGCILLHSYMTKLAKESVSLGLEEKLFIVFFNVMYNCFSIIECKMQRGMNQVLYLSALAITLSNIINGFPIMNKATNAHVAFVFIVIFGSTMYYSKFFGLKNV